MPDERTPSRIADEHDALRERASELPWTVVGRWEQGGLGIEHHASDDLDDPRSCAITYARGSHLPPLPANAAYITAIANDDAAMCAAVRALEAEVARLQAVLDRIECPNCGSMACTNPTTGEIDGWMIPVPPVPDEAPQ